MALERLWSSIENSSCKRLARASSSSICVWVLVPAPPNAYPLPEKGMKVLLAVADTLPEALESWANTPTHFATRQHGQQPNFQCGYARLKRQSFASHLLFLPKDRTNLLKIATTHSSSTPTKENLQNMNTFCPEMAPHKSGYVFLLMRTLHIRWVEQTLILRIFIFLTF